MSKKIISKKGLKHFVLDVDGILTDGRYYYAPEGKAMKIFGADDHDALRLGLQKGRGEWGK